MPVLLLNEGFFLIDYNQKSITLTFDTLVNILK